MNTYEQNKRLKKAELADVPRTELESFNEGADSSLGNVRQTVGNCFFDQPVKLEALPHNFSSSTSAKGERFEDGLPSEVVQNSLDESLDCSSSGVRCKDAQMHFSSGVPCKDAQMHLNIEKQSLPKHVTTKKRKSFEADMSESNHLEERHNEANETLSIVDDNALGGDTPLYLEEQPVASHVDFSLEQLELIELALGSEVIENIDVPVDTALTGLGVASEEVVENIDVPVDRAFTGFKQKKLLVLDINGLLVDISPYVPYNHDPDDIIMKKAVFRRPHCDDFLNFCFEKFHVGFWTSRTKRNMEPLLDFLLGNNKERLLFCWDQSHCTDTGFYTVEKRDKPLILKKLKKLWDKSEPGLPWERGMYNKSNTLLLDDTPYKALSNPQYTAVFPHTYRFRDVRDNSLGPGGDLRVYLEGLAETEDVQEYVKQNPFGQRPITEKDLSWGYYRKVIEANKTPPRETDTDDP